MIPIGVPPSSPFHDKGVDGVSSAQARDVLRTFRKALAVQGLAEASAEGPDIVTFSNEAREKAAHYDSAKTEGV